MDSWVPLGSPWFHPDLGPTWAPVHRRFEYGPFRTLGLWYQEQLWPPGYPWDRLGDPETGASEESRQSNWYHHGLLCESGDEAQNLVPHPVHVHVLMHY